MISESDIDKAVSYLRDSSQEAAQARANVRHIDKFLETKAAQIAARMMEKGMSAAAAKLTCKADPEYIELLEGYKVAVEVDAYHAHKREAADTAIRAWQTMCSNARTEGRAYG